MFASGDLRAAAAGTKAVAPIAQMATASASGIRMRPIEYPLGEVADLLLSVRLRGELSGLANVRYGRGNASDSPRAGTAPAKWFPRSPEWPLAIRRPELYKCYRTAA